MMLRLYKFTCAANYPVGKGVIIFADKDYDSIVMAFHKAKKLAEKLGFTNWQEQDARVEYLGTFMPANEAPTPHVVHYANGEY